MSEPAFVIVPGEFVSADVALPDDHFEPLIWSSVRTPDSVKWRKPFCHRARQAESTRGGVHRPKYHNMDMDSFAPDLYWPLINYLCSYEGFGKNFGNCFLLANTLVGRFRYQVFVVDNKQRSFALVVVCNQERPFTPIAFATAKMVQAGIAKVFVHCGRICVAVSQLLIALEEGWEVSPHSLGATCQTKVPWRIRDLLLIRATILSAGEAFALDEISNSIVAVKREAANVICERFGEIYKAAHTSRPEHHLQLQTIFRRDVVQILHRRIQSCDIDMRGRIVLASKDQIVVLAPDGELLAKARLDSLSRMQDTRVATVVLVRGGRIFALRQLRGQLPDTFQELHLAPNFNQALKVRFATAVLAEL